MHEHEGTLCFSGSVKILDGIWIFAVASRLILHLRLHWMSSSALSLKRIFPHRLSTDLSSFLIHAIWSVLHTYFMSKADWMNKFDRFTSHRLHLPHFLLYGAKALQTPPTTCEMIASESERVSEIKKGYLCIYREYQTNCLPWSRSKNALTSNIYLFYACLTLLCWINFSSSVQRTAQCQ